MHKIDDSPPVVLVVSSLKDDRKECTESTNFVKDYEDNGFNFISPGLPAMCSVETSRPETSIAPPMLTDLLAEQAKDVFCREIAATVVMPSL